MAYLVIYFVFLSPKYIFGSYHLYSYLPFVLMSYRRVLAREIDTNKINWKIY